MFAPGSRARGPVVIALLAMAIVTTLLPLGVCALSTEGLPVAVYLPLVLKSYPNIAPTWTATSTPIPTPTQTWTPTPTSPAVASRTPTPTATKLPQATVTPSPTKTACPLDNVTGTYNVESSNLVHNCPDAPPVLLSGDVAVAQDGSVLTIEVEGEDIVGTIDEHSGEFQIQTSVNTPPFTVLYRLAGVFSLGQNPMMFDAVGTANIDFLGAPFCSATSDVTGVRTSCEVAP
jgi:hypothetical protein